MLITYAGQPLLLEDPDHSLQLWLDRYLSLADMRLFGCQPVAREEGRQAARNPILARVGLPTPNWSLPPRPKLNTLWWPTGATRWGIGLFLADTETVDKIIQTGIDSTGAAFLEFDEEVEANSSHSTRKMSARMHLLPPRQLTSLRVGQGYSTEELKNLYLLPLVDKRFFWRHMDAGALQVSCSTSWSAVFAALAAGIGESIEVDSIGGAYCNPDWTELTRQYENVAVLLDAVAWSLGQRIVLTLDGQVRSMDYSTSQQIHDGNTGGWPAGAAGAVDVGTFNENGNFSRLTGDWDDTYENPRKPATVRVVFPRYKSNVPQADGAIWVETYSLTAFGSDVVAGRTKTFYDTCQADFTNDPIKPHNKSSLEALTTQIASDYYYYMDGGTYDLSCHGVKFWVPSGYDDFVWWHFGYQYPLGDGGRGIDDGMDGGAADNGGQAGDDYACFTRACSLPYDCEVSELLHQMCREDSSSSSESSESDSDSSDEEVTIDVVVCEPWNRCTNYLVFPQKRIYLPAGTVITDLPATVVPLYECQSSDSDPSEWSDPPSDSTGDSSAGSAGEGWTDIDIVWTDLVVEGNPTLTPSGYTGTYSNGQGYHEGRPFWYKYDPAGTYFIWWNDVVNCWMLSRVGSEDAGCWFKRHDPTDWLGDYTPVGVGFSGIATVSEGGLP